MSEFPYVSDFAVGAILGSIIGAVAALWARGRE